MRGFDSCYPCIYTRINNLDVFSGYSFLVRPRFIAIPRYSVATSALYSKKRFRLPIVNRYRLGQFIDDNVVQRNTTISSLRLKRNYVKLKSFIRFNVARLSLSPNVRRPDKDFCYRFNKEVNLVKKSPTFYSGINSFLKTKNLIDNLTWFGTLAILPSQTLANKLLMHRFRFKSIAGFNISDYTSKSLLEFLVFSSGSRSFIQFYPFLAQGNISAYRVSFYKTWISRLEFYQKRLGHRFFMEETIHIMHLAMSLHDSKLFTTWLGSLIKRISFWKTRSIFRYLLYLFNNFFNSELGSINCKGIKLRLKGKISAAGNSRKRLVSLKFGKVSYSTLDIKCLRSNVIITTFTGAMNLRVEIFY